MTRRPSSGSSQPEPGTQAEPGTQPEPGTWSGPVWGAPSTASRALVPARSITTAADAAYRAEGGFTEHFAVLGASVAGVSHRLAGRRCDDAFGWARAGPGTLVLVVADGVSGARLGGRGAEIAVSAVCRHVVQWEQSQSSLSQVDGAHGTGASVAGASGAGAALYRSAIMSANGALLSAAEEAGSQSNELSTTVLVSALQYGSLQAHGDDRVHVSTACIGDSAGFVLAGGNWQEITGGTAPAGDGATAAGPLGRGTGDSGAGDSGAGDRSIGETGADVALLSPLTAALPELEFDEVRDIGVSSFDIGAGDVLVLMTDGVANPLRDGPTTVAPALAELLTPGPGGALSPLDLARAIDFSRRGCQDDRTVLAVWALGHPFGGPLG